MKLNKNKNRKIIPSKTEINLLFKKLFKINRSLTGNGNVETLKILNEIIPLKIKSLKSGSKVYDWKIPSEWSINDAFIINSKGKKILDWKKNNLHVVNYSEPIEKKNVSKKELLKHIHTLPSNKKWVPYRTSYYDKKWGFCATQELIESSDFSEPFEICIDSDFKKNGKLVFAEAFHAGKSKKEILISSYICHPSMANDNLSGIITAIYFFNYIKNFNTYYSYRLVLCPETIGALAFLKKHNNPQKILCGFVVSTTAGPGEISLKESFLGDHFIDKLGKIAISNENKRWKKYKFKPDGSDERQYSSPGFRIPTITISKSKYHEYKEYHTSADNLNFVKDKFLLSSLNTYIKIFNLLELNRLYIRNSLFGEYQLGKRGVYPSIGGPRAELRKKIGKLNNITGKHIEAFGWIMHLADGNNSVLDISEKSEIDLNIVIESCKIFFDKKLLKVVG